MSVDNVYSIGSRRELFVDTWLIEAMHGGAALRLHRPVAREEALVTDKPWEGNMCGYVTVFRDGDRVRMYYRTGHFDPAAGCNPLSHFVIACAESTDGVHWERPVLGLYEHDGSRENNIVWWGEAPEQRGVHGFAPFVDSRPDVSPEARFKAVGAQSHATGSGLYAVVSPDGIRWRLLQQDPVLEGCAFDSQNLAFWDGERQEYRAFVRDFQDGRRDIKTCTSRDFIHWSEPAWLEYPGAPSEQLYTNQIQPYCRAPHIFVGFPTRYVERSWSPAVEALPELEHRRLRGALSPRYGAALTDGLFMSSRDGLTFRRWPEAFLRPGLQLEGNWAYGDNYQGWGMVETSSARAGAPPELSFYVTEHYWRGEFTVFRRYTLRMDGFVSINAPASGGEVLTRPFRFKGGRLCLNMSTSAAGGVWVEMQTADGQPIEHFALDDCHEIVGDELERTVTWQQGSDVAALADRPIRLRFVLRDADLYAICFK